jgi:poly-gamma-glutamate capsule biosynthesis protein CapA/YwtB (metallophosphatase superfamily)
MAKGGWRNYSSSRRRRIVIAIVAVCVMAFGGWGVLLFAVQSASSQSPGSVGSPSGTPAISSSPTPTPTPTDTRVKVSAMGDMLPHDTVNAAALQPDGSYDYTPFLSSIKPLVADSDIVFCNQEVSSAGAAFGISGYPVFNAPEKFSADLVNGAGCNAINIANNHMADKGQDSINATRAVWDNLGPRLISGANRSPEEQQVVTVTDVQGIKFALVSFAEYSNVPATDYGLNVFGNDAVLTSVMATARANADVVLVSMHWGTEYSNGVNDAQRNEAARLVELGADVIIGTGPHVLEPVEWIPATDGSQTLVWFSIGNLLSTQLEISQLIGGIAQFDVVKTPAGVISIEVPSFIPTYMHYEWSPAEAAAGNLLARHNLHVYPLADAAEPLSRSFFNTSVDEQQAYVTSILGPLVTIK